MLDQFRKLRYHTTHKWHCKLSENNRLYCSWHKEPLHHHLHWSFLFFFLVILLPTIYFPYINSADAEKYDKDKKVKEEKVEKIKDRDQDEKPEDQVENNPISIFIESVAEIISPAEAPQEVLEATIMVEDKDSLEIKNDIIVNNLQIDPITTTSTEEIVSTSTTSLFENTEEILNFSSSSSTINNSLTEIASTTTTTTITTIENISESQVVRSGGGSYIYFPPVEPMNVLPIQGEPIVLTPISSSTIEILPQVTNNVNLSNSLELAKNESNIISSPIVFKVESRYGVRNIEIKDLQQFLNKNGFILAKTGAGAPGKETNFFGLKTRQALITMQEKYSFEIFGAKKIPKNSLGIFDSQTRAFVNSFFLEQ